MNSSTWSLSLARWNFSAMYIEAVAGLQVVEDEPGALICHLIQEQKVCLLDHHPDCGHGEVHGPAVDEVDGLLHASLGDPRQLEDLLTGFFPSSKDVTEQGGEKLALSSQDDLVTEELVTLTLQCDV